MHSGTFIVSKDQDVGIFGQAVPVPITITNNVHFGHLITVVPSDSSIFVTSLPFVINKYFV